jgi:hypothetical protein
MLRPWRRFGGWLAGLGLVAAVLWSALPPLAAGLHGLWRDAVRAEATVGVTGEPSLATQHFIIYYPPGYAADARIIANQAEQAYPFVFGQLGGAPAGRLPIIVESRAGFAQVLHQPARDDPLGAYWRGVVWLLAPQDYLPGDASERARALAAVGTVVHELTHVADDDLTAGRLPAWLDEGVAQYMQWRWSGYVWREPDNSFCQSLYSWSQLATAFDSLPNQALAYRQSFAVIQALAAGRPDAVRALLTAIGDGQTPERAMAAIVGPQQLARLQAGAAWSCGAADAAAAATP